jgi:hypothetical protein
LVRSSHTNAPANTFRKFEADGNRHCAPASTA